MNFKKSYLQESATEQFQEAKKPQSVDSKTSEKFYIGAHEAMASFYMANDNESYSEHIDAASALKLKYINTYNEAIWPDSKNNYVFLSLSVNKLERAKEFCSFDTDYINSHSFTITVNCLLRKLLSVSTPVSQPKYNPSLSEQRLFDGLIAAIKKDEIAEDSLKGYWKATRSKRYKNTIFENLDLFTLAISNAKKII